MDLKAGDVLHMTSMTVNAYADDGSRAQFSFSATKGNEFVCYYMGTRPKGKDTISAMDRLRTLGFMPVPIVYASHSDVTQWEGYVQTRFPYTYAYDLLRTYINPASKPFSRATGARFTRKMFTNPEEHREMMETLAKLYIAKQHLLETIEENIKLVLEHNGFFKEEVLELIKNTEETGE
jgi:hypothetical protein